MQRNKLILGIDIGNTNVEFGFINNKITSFKIHSNQDKSPDQWIFDILSIHSLTLIEKESIEDIVISSVVPLLTEKIKQAAFKFYGKIPKIIGEDLKYPIKINYDNPEEVGADRIVNSVAALKLVNPPVVVIDLGTAITFDVINEKGEYEGGLIFPGIDSSISALVSKTAKLPKVNIKETVSVVGKSTQESIQSGIFYGYISLIEGVINKIKIELKKEPNIILTGGHSEIITKKLNLKHKVEKELIMLGIKEIYFWNKQV
jgi:type III pantothenate kinase